MTTVTAPPAASRPTIGVLDGPPVAAGRWPLAGLAAGVAGLASGALLVGPWVDDPAVYAAGPDALFRAISQEGGQLAVQLGAAVGYLTAALLVPFGIGLVITLARRVPERVTAISGVALALAASVATLVCGYAFKSVFASGMPGGIDADFYTSVDVTVSYTLSNQLQYAGHLPLVGAAGIVAWLSLRHGAMQRWIGVLSAVMAVAVVTVTVALNLPWSAGLAAPAWLVATSIALLRLRRRDT